MEQSEKQLSASFNNVQILDGNSTKPEKTKWRQVLYDFMQNSTLHGLNKISEDQPYRARRILWIMIVACGVALFVFQVFNSVLLFYDRPVSVNVKVNYNDTLKFPAVTICNHNDFRMSRVADLGWYDQLIDLFNNHARKNDSSDHEGKGKKHDDNLSKNYTMEYILSKTAHQHDDLIISCKWAGEDCNVMDFKRVLTDYGVCFTFNGDGHINKDKLVTQQGSSGGLRMQINIEQYEYMTGPSDGAGLKILIHSPEEFPLVKYQGQAIAPGSHTLVGISILEVHNLPEPYGKCDDSVKLEHFPYSVAACQTECKQKIVIERCKCRDFYIIPDKEYPLPPCTLVDMMNCVNPIMERTGANTLDCNCPTPCRQTIYDPLITGGVLSELDKDKLLTSNQTYLNILKRQFLNAREKHQWFDEHLKNIDKTFVVEMYKEIDNIELIIAKARNKIEMVLEKINELVRIYRPQLTIHRNILKFAEFIIRYNYVRGYSYRHDRYFQFVARDFFVFLLDMDVLYDDIKNGNEGHRQFAINEMRTKIRSRYNLTEIARVNLEKVAEGFITGKKLSIYNYTGVFRYDILFTSVCFSPLSKELKQIFTDIDTLGCAPILKALDSFSSLLDNATLNLEMNEEVWNTARYNYKKGSKKFTYRNFLINDRIIQKPLNNVHIKIAILEDKTKEFDRATSKLITIGSELLQSIESFNMSYQTLDRLTKYAKLYIVDETATKTQFVKFVTGYSVENALMELNKLFDLMRSRDVFMHDELVKLLSVTEHLTVQLTDVCTEPVYTNILKDAGAYYPSNTTEKNCLDIEKVIQKVLALKHCGHSRRINKPEILNRFNVSTSRLKEISTDRVMELIKRAALTSVVASHDDRLIHHFREYNKYFKKFIEDSKLDTKFVRDNFMNLDIFMRELSYEEITQQIGYTQTNLWSDIGGSMGLFIGASVITAFEILDALFYHGTRVTRQKRSLK